MTPLKLQSTFSNNPQPFPSNTHSVDYYATAEDAFRTNEHSLISDKFIPKQGAMAMEQDRCFI